MPLDLKSSIEKVRERAQSLIPLNFFEKIKEKLPFRKKEEGPTPQEIERRKDVRVPLRVVRVWSQTEDGKRGFLGYARDVSLGGLFIQMVTPLQQGTPLKIAFQLIEGEAEIHTEVQVAWTRRFNPRSKLEAGIGVQFLNFSDKGRAAIQSWVERGPH
jgi:uncharacterized protein (TIGR02266 family)